MSVHLGLFDSMHVDPSNDSTHAQALASRLDDLAYADELGLEFAFTSERHYLPHFRGPAPTAWIAAASQRTTRMRLGALAYPLPLHDPVRLAEEVAVLDHLCGGRLEVGVDLGQRAEEYVANGIDPETRIATFQERLAVLEALWSGASVTLDGRSVTLLDVSTFPLPLQEPHPPLWFMSNDPAAATWAGGRGFHLAVGFAPLRDLIPAVAGFKGGRLVRKGDGSGEALHAPSIALIQHVVIADADDAARADAVRALARVNAAAVGASPEDAAVTAAAADELDRLIGQELFLVGGPERIANGIRFAAKALGVTHYLSNVWSPGLDQDQVRRSIRLLATAVHAELGRDPVAGGLAVQVSS